MGTTLAQAFPMLFYPVLARIFSPAHFGLFATFTAITSILAVLGSAKYESSILVVPTKQDAANIIAFILLLSGIFVCLTSLLLFFFSGEFADIFNQPDLEKWLFICPISAFSIIIFNCYNEWCIRNKYFNTLSWNKISNAASTTLSKLFFGIIQLLNQGLVLGDLLGRFISAGSCIFRALKKDKKIFSEISYKQMLAVARQNIEFPKFTLPDQLLSTLGGFIPVFFIGAYFNNAEVGFYAMTMNIITVPITIISFALKDVFRQRAQEDFVKHGTCRYIFIKLLKFLTLWVTIASVVLFFLIPTVFNLVLGETWQKAGIYAQILLPMISLSFISNSLSGVLIISRKLRISMYWQVYYMSITFISLALGFAFFGDIKSVFISFVIGRISAYLLYILLSYRYSIGDNFK
jgi:O-antigen/teichoic acid export membrane protein